MSKIDPEKNCHEYCPIAKCCRYALGEVGINYEECGTYYKLLDLIEDEKDIKREQMKCRAFDEEDDW